MFTGDKMNTLFIDIAIWIVTFLLIFSKFLDCYTTSTRIIDLKYERNPIARRLMKTFGIRKAIWLTFLLTIFIVGISVLLIYTVYESIVLKFIYIILGGFITIVQFAVAYTNKTGLLNFVTKILSRVYRI